MDISESVAKAKEIGAWIHSKTNDIPVQNNSRIHMGVALLQHALDITDAMTLLVDRNLPGPAFSLLRPLHEAYTRGVWLLDHASDEAVEKFGKRKYPGFKDMLKDIGDDPETGGAFIKGMSELNREDFHGLTHGGIEHIIRRISPSAIEPNYPVEEIQKLLKVRNQYSSLIACFLLQLVGDEGGVNQLAEKRNEWRGAL
ncbi:hypothetical protein CWE12_12535 [Aliidiomarina sedimenti]|uniref:AbiV family abortive infection protein n=1 Tax=Aliidiomarina sedimenti TaxID=1933879 RepID=A0ABY0BUX6_9GAMM|nr:hypothetical protein [Aliidiomarina sedimenti]RUO28046.1 hypothetical protein CWE12_12535 [Aliidiomarina sedimenti]